MCDLVTGMVAKLQNGNRIVSTVLVGVIESHVNPEYMCIMPIKSEDIEAFGGVDMITN